MSFGDFETRLVTVNFVQPELSFAVTPTLGAACAMMDFVADRLHQPFSCAC